MGLWNIFFPIKDESEDNCDTKVSIQPTYRHMRIRSSMLRQVRNSRLKLRKTFIIEVYGQTIIRGCAI